MVNMIDVEDFRDLCSRQADAHQEEKDNETKYLIMKNYSVERRVSDRVAFGALSFGIGFCLCTIGQYPLSATELQLLMLGAPAAVSLIGCDILEIGCRKSYKNLTAAKTWYNKISEQAYYKVQMFTAKRKGEAYYKTIKRLEEADFEFGLDFSSMSKEECKSKLKELEQQAKEAEEKVELYALKEAIISEFGRQMNFGNVCLEVGASVLAGGFLSAIVDILPNLVNEAVYGPYLGTGIDSILISGAVGTMVGAYKFSKIQKRRKVLKDYNRWLEDENVFYKDKKIYEKTNAAVDCMADANLSLIFYKGYMKSLENCEEINKKFIRTQQVDV